MADFSKMNDTFRQLFSGFSKLDLEERLTRLVQMGALQPEDVPFLKKSNAVTIDLAEKLIENAIGYFQIPLGVAANFVINGRGYAIPMAVEETSIIAAASKTAKWVRDHGEITTCMKGEAIIGQIQLAKVKDYALVEQQILAKKEELIRSANDVPAAGLVKRGGGVVDLQVRRVPREDRSSENFGVAGGDMAVVHIYANACDAMGANIMNQICEFLKPQIEDICHETVTMCILSNLVDSRLTQATVRLSGIDEELMEKIEEASLFAWQDPYRAATNNKGVLNGIDPILIATGNDWRAVEAGVHAFAARSGQYRSITRWQREGQDLVGRFEAPIVLGVVGGVTRLHPTAKLSLRMLGVSNASELSQVCAAVGLVQNLGALRALTTVGIIEGHMKLHIKNLAIGAGAKEKEIPKVQKRLEEILAMTKRISLSNAIEVLRELRSTATAATSTPTETTSRL